jgi:hypothetical protein
LRLRAAKGWAELLSIEDRKTLMDRARGDLRAEDRRAEAKLRGQEYNFGTVRLKRDDAVFCIRNIPA